MKKARVFNPEKFCSPFFGKPKPTSFFLKISGGKKKLQTFRGGKKKKRTEKIFEKTNLNKEKLLGQKKKGPGLADGITAKNFFAQR